MFVSVSEETNNREMDTQVMNFSRMFVSNVRRFVRTYVLPYGRVFGYGIPIPPSSFFT